MSSQNNADRPNDYSRVSRRFEKHPKYAEAFIVEMNLLAETIAKKIGESGVKLIGPLRGELARLLKETDKEIFENAAGDKFIFRLFPDGFVPGLYPKYEPSTDLTPHTGNVILYKDEASGELFVPHKLLPIPFDITVDKIVAMKGPVGKRLLGALPAKPEAEAQEAIAAKGPEAKAEKVATLLSEENRIRQERAEAQHREEIAAERLRAKLQKHRQRISRRAKEAGHQVAAPPVRASLEQAVQRVTAAKPSLTAQERKAAREMSTRLVLFKAGLSKLSHAVGRAARDTKKGNQSAAAAELAIEKLTAKLVNIKLAPERGDVIAEAIAVKQETLAQAQARVRKAQERLDEAQEALEEYKLMHPDPAKPKDTADAAATSHPARMTVAARTHAEPT